MLTSLSTDSGLPGDLITNDSTPTLSGTADPRTRVLISVDGGAPTIVQADAHGAWSMSTTLGNGPHPVTLSGEDAAGNAFGPGASVVVTIDITAPAAPVITAITDDTGMSSTDFNTKDQTLVVSTHRHNMLSICDRLIVIDAGRIIADGPRDTVLGKLKSMGKKEGTE